MKTRYIGNVTTQNVDGPDKVTGRAKYVADMTMPDMLYAKVLHSPVPHARILRLDVSPALAIPGVRAAITSDDFVEYGNFGFPVKDMYILAFQKVRYVGDPIAVVAAETPEAAQAGVEAIVLELEELPVVADMKSAMSSTASLVPLTAPLEQGNLCAEDIVRNGDPGPLLADSAVVLEQRYEFPHQEQAYIEPEAVLAVPEPDGGVTVFTNNQSPFECRDVLVETLGLPPEAVRIVQPPVGGAFGGKDEPLYQCSAQAARLAMYTGRPVKLVFTREESLMTSYKRQAMNIHLRIGADQDGNLTAAQATLLADSGGYASMTPFVLWRATVHAAGAYRYQAVQVDAEAVYTNNGYAGAFRGFGNTQAAAAIEMAIDELAQRLGRDPLDFRLQNCLRQGDRTMTGDVIEHEVGLAECLEWVRDHSEWSRKRAEYAQQPADALKRRGIGVACYFHGCGLGSEGEDFAVTTLRIAPDGNITLTSGLTDYGQGSRTVFTLIAAEVLGVSPERIHILRPDTYTARNSGPTVASRSSIVGGNATRVAAEKLAHTLRLAAADALGCTEEQIVRDGEAFIGPDENPLPLEKVVAHARQMGLQLSTVGRWHAPPIEWDFEKGHGRPYFAYVFGAQVAEVEVNQRTGKVSVLHIWAAHDGGTILYPTGALGQLYGGIAQGLGYALMESFRYENGYPQTLSLAKYTIPRAKDVPPITGTYIQTRLKDGPFGAKNLAEPVMIGTAPAIANAVFQATGERFHSLPIRPQKK